MNNGGKERRYYRGPPFKQSLSLLAPAASAGRVGRNEPRDAEHRPEPRQPDSKRLISFPLLRRNLDRRLPAPSLRWDRLPCKGAILSAAVSLQGLSLNISSQPSR